MDRQSSDTVKLNKYEQSTINTITTSEGVNELPKLWLLHIERRGLISSYSRFWMIMVLLLFSSIFTIFMTDHLWYFLINFLLISLYILSWQSFNIFSYRLKETAQHNSITFITFTFILSSLYSTWYLITHRFGVAWLIVVIVFHLMIYTLPVIETFHIREIIFKMYFPFDLKDGVLQVEHIPDLVSWLYSEDIILTTMAVRFSQLLDTKNQDIVEALETTERNYQELDNLHQLIVESQSMVEELSEDERVIENEIVDEIEEQPADVDHETDEPEEIQYTIPAKAKQLQVNSEGSRFEKLIGKIYSWYNSHFGKEKSEVELMIDERRCCKLHGRLGDTYCNMCGRVVPEELVVKDETT